MSKTLIFPFLVLISSLASAQEGILFDPVSGPTGGRVIDIESNSSLELFAISDDKLYRSSDNAVSWQDITPNNGNSGLIDVFVDNSDKIYLLDKTRVWTSVDNGTTWAFVTATGAYNPRGKLLKNPNTGSLFCMSNTNFGLMRSSNDGVSWTLVYDGSSADLRDYTIGNSGLIFLGTNGGSSLYKSSNDGLAFVDSADPGLTNPRPGATILNVELNKSNGKIYILYYATEGVYVTNNGSNDGTSWAQVTVASPITFGIPANGFYNLIGSKTTNRVFIRAGQELFYSDNATSITASWTQLNNYNPGNNEFLVGRALSSANILIGLGEDGIYGSTTSGTSWSFRDVGIYNNRNRSFIRANNGNLLAVNGGGTISFSDNNGQTWSKQVLCNSCNFTSLIKKPNGNLLAIGTETYGSTAANGGANGTWTDLGGPPPSIAVERAVSSDGDLIWGISNETVLYRSTNGGVSFGTPTINGLPSPLRAFRLGLSASNDLFVWTDTDEIYKVPATAGTPPFTATKVTNSGLTSFRGIKSVGGSVFLFGFDDVLGSEAYAKSNDGGVNWTRQKIEANNDVFVVNSDIMFSLESTGGNQASITFSNDGGIGWIDIFDGPFYDSEIAGAAIDQNGIAYLVISGAELRRSQSTVVKPAKPTNLKTVGVADREVYLEWDYSAAGGASLDYYEVHRKLTSEGSFVKIGEADGSEFYYVDRTVGKNVSYDYKIIAGSLAGETESDPITVVTKDDCPLALPDNRSWSGVATPGGPFNVNPVVIRKSSSDYYLISEFTAGSLNGVPRNGGGTYSSSSVSTYINYACGTPFIEEKDDVFPDGNGTWNGTNTITLKFQINKGEYTDTGKTITLTLNATDPTPSIPQNVSASVINDTQIEIQWTAGDYQQVYTVERSLTASTGFSQIATVNYPSVKVTDSGPFTNGTAYFYRVKAKNINDVESGYSSEASIVFGKPIFTLSNTVVSATQASTPTLAWADMDNDGFEDLILAKLNFLAANAEEPLLFKNNSGTDFQAITGKFPTALNLAGPTIADYNNDGNLDIFISGFGLDGSGNTPVNLLIRNEGNLTFTNVDTSPVTVVPMGQSSIGASWIDVNSNGFLDLFIPYEDNSEQQLFAGSAGGVFTDNTAVGALVTDDFSKGAAFWADYDNDGDMDVFVLGDPNRLYKNDGGVFTHVLDPAINNTIGGRYFSASWGDYNNDQFLDIFVADQEGPNLLFKNNGNGTFSKIAAAANSPTENVTATTTGTAWGDIDNDGDLDLIAAGAGSPNVMYINQGAGTFTKVTNELITGFNPIFSLGTALADYDNDGHLDVAIGSLNFPLGGESGVLGDAPNIKLFKNNLTTGNWLKVKLNGAGGSQAAISNRDAIGSRIKIVAGGKTQIREVTTSSGIGSQNSLIAHFGLGAETTITSIEVRFPSGGTKTLTNVAVNQMLTITEDSEGPLFSAFTPENKDKGFGQYDITLGANDAVAVSNMTLRARPIGGTTFSSQPMGKVSGTNNWQISVTESNYDDMGMEFFFEAADPFGNTTRSPATGNYYSYLNYKETNAPKFPTSSLVFGGTDRTWNIVSIPFDLGSSATVTSVLDELGSFDDTQWRLLTYQNQTDWGEFPTNFSSFTRGKGYFLNVKTPPSAGITIADPILAPQNNQSDLFTIGLNQGWNQIGNPYLVPIKWSDVKAFNSTVSGVGDLKLYDSNGRTYVDGDAMAVYQGGFVFASETVQDYAISFAGQAPGGRKKNAAGRKYSTELDSERWRTMFTLKQSDVEFKLGGIGMSPDAKVSYDDNDDVTLPRLADFLEVNFHHPEHFAKRFSRDIVPTQNEYTWEFTVDSNLGGIASLEWDNEVFGLNDRDLFLLDVAQQKLIDMREVNSYSFDSDNANKFKVYYGSNLNGRIQPEKILLGQAWPNPARDVTTIPFTLPASNEMFQVRLEVYDMMGRRVSVLHEGQLPSGFYESLWNTSSGQWTNGIYTYRLAVAGAGKSEVFSNKIILNK